MTPFKTLLVTLLAAFSLGAMAQEATIRNNLTERLPNLPRIDEISKTPKNGLYEVRVNESEIFYTDAQGNFLIQGSLIDTQARVDLTAQRMDRLTSIAFKDLPLKDAFTIVRGKGTRQMAVFEDPNCGFCKRFERDLLTIDDVTVHVFLYPILGPDSADKSRNIWCAKDKGKVFLDWMVRGVTPAPAKCDVAALERNVEFGRKYRITGTPASFFVDGRRVPGAVGADQIEQALAAAKP
jgi:thiol:disulfide interchange protein DsbC